jgi:hypothetical protein
MRKTITILVIGKVTRDEYKPTSLSLLRGGYKPRIVRTNMESLLDRGTLTKLNEQAFTMAWNETRELGIPDETEEFNQALGARTDKYVFRILGDHFKENAPNIRDADLVLMDLSSAQRLYDIDTSLAPRRLLCDFFIERIRGRRMMARVLVVMPGETRPFAELVHYDELAVS